VIRPALLRDAWVVCDRFVDSSLAYQGAARGLGLEAVRELNAAATGGLSPDLTFVLLLDPELALERRAAAKPDRIEREDADFVRRVDAGYRELVATSPQRYVVLDGAQPAVDIVQRVLRELRHLIPA
jgi:dTMP kinase